MATMTNRALGFLDGKSAGMQIVARRDNRKQQDQDAAESTKKKKRAPDGPVGRGSSPPQQERGQHQGQPAKIKKKLYHPSVPGTCPREARESPALPKANVSKIKDSTGKHSRLSTTVPGQNDAWRRVLAFKVPPQCAKPSASGDAGEECYF